MDRHLVFSALAGLMLLLPAVGNAQAKIGQIDKGMASYYGDKFHGRPTASGERFDKNAKTAAHRTLPFGTMLEVTNLRNSKQVVVRVNDRGPFKRGRIIDLSKQAAYEIGLHKSGTGPVRIRVVGKQGQISPEAEPVGGRQPTASKGQAGKSGKADKPDKAAKEQAMAYEKTAKDQKRKASAKAEEAGDADRPRSKGAGPTRERFQGKGTYTYKGQALQKSGFCVQVGAFGVLQNAVEMARRVRSAGYHKVYIQTRPNDPNKTPYKVVVGEYESRPVARQNREELKKRGIEGFVSQHLGQ
jgi:rare lipoprotein A